MTTQTNKSPTPRADAQLEAKFNLDCLAGNLTTFDAISGYVSKLELENQSKANQLAIAREALEKIDKELKRIGAAKFAERDFQAHFRRLFYEVANIKPIAIEALATLTKKGNGE